MDEKADYDNCPCKLCTPEDFLKAAEEMKALQIEHFGPRVKTEKSQASKSLGAKPVPTKEEKKSYGEKIPGAKEERKHQQEGSLAKVEKKATIVRTNPAVVVPARSTSQPQERRLEPQSGMLRAPNMNRTASSSSTGLTRSPSATGPPPAIATALPPMLNEEQRLDAESNQLIYRPGELVWNDRSEGQAVSWGLSVITKRTLIRDSSNHLHPQYTVQPLSHPYHNPPALTLSEPKSLRPFLAWSTPPATHDFLQNSTLSYDKVDWVGILQNHYGPGDAQVDGSIFAAKAIDASYTLIQPLTTPNPSNPSAPIHYNGIFLGAEKIWLGEPIRLRIGTGRDLMILHQLTSTPVVRPNGTRTYDIHVIGDVYTFTTMPYDGSNMPVPHNAHLPRRLLADLAARNNPIALHRRHTLSLWTLVHSQLRLNVSQVKGRWYESSLLLPVLQREEDYQSALRNGELADVGNLLNPRGLATLTVDSPPGRSEDRVRTFGQAVPAGLVVRFNTAVEDGSVGGGLVVDPALMDVDGDGDEGRGRGRQEASLEEFMDVEQMD